MKILLLGATGHVGRQVLTQALAAGHSVTALVRTPAKLAVTHPNLTLVTGDARDAALIAQAMAGTDAVISALGHNSAKTTDVQTVATRAVLAGLQPGQRFISLTGHGVPDTRDVRHPLSGRLLKLMIQLLPGGIFRDGVEHAKLMRGSSAQWVLVRAPRIVAGETTDNFQSGYLPVSLFSTVTRGDVAAFMLSNLSTDQWLRQAPLIVGR